MFSIRSICAQARQTLYTSPGIYLLAVLPVGLSVLVSLFSAATGGLSQEVTLVLSGGLLSYLIRYLAFSSVYQLLLTLLYLSISLTLFRIIRYKKGSSQVVDGLSLFDSAYLGKALKTLLLKTFFLILFALPLFIGIVSLLFSIALPSMYVLQTGVSQLSQIPAEIISVTQVAFLAGLVLSLVGCLLYFPQVYAYSQAEFVLFEQIEKNDYKGALYILKESRQLMKGYKRQRFVLDLTFIGWFLLSGISFGLAGLYVLPYYSAAQMHFHEALLKERSLKEAYDFN